MGEGRGEKTQGRRRRKTKGATTQVLSGVETRMPQFCVAQIKSVGRIPKGFATGCPDGEGTVQKKEIVTQGKEGEKSGNSQGQRGTVSRENERPQKGGSSEKALAGCAISSSESKKLPRK